MFPETALARKPEVEIKFRVADAGRLQRALAACGFRRLTPPTHESNTLYDRGNTLRRRGEILRLRKYGGQWRLTHKAKGKAGRHKVRTEHESVVADGLEIDALLHALGYKPAFVYEKFRSEWSDGTGKVVVDHTPIGIIAEIEGPPRWIDRTARRLGIGTRDYITKSYGELFLEWRKATRSAARNMTFSECGTRFRS